MKSKQTRIETDALGSYKLPLDAPRGIFTARVLNNFPQKGVTPIPEEFLRNYVRVKIVYARLNEKYGKLTKKNRDAIIRAAHHLLTLSSTEFTAFFPIHQIQSGGGTSTNMNVNEVIANLATKELGGTFGQYLVNPHDHVNLSQSSNDTFPGTTKITLLQKGSELHHVLKQVGKTLQKLAKKFHKIKKVGRTHLQDAVVISLGDEFGAYARTIEKNIHGLEHVLSILHEVNFGATATGSKQNITRAMRKDLIHMLNKEFHLKLSPAQNYFEQSSSAGDFNALAAILTHLATDLIKIGNDLRLLAGFHEIELPAVQPGSSIMPGKINPSIIEALTMICAKVIGNSTTVHQLTALAQLELEQFMPGIARALTKSVHLLIGGLTSLDHHCLQGIRANKKQISRLLDHSLATATDYTQAYGYEVVAQAVQESLESGKTLKEILDKKTPKKI